MLCATEYIRVIPIRGGDAININEISKLTGLPYSTTRKYLLLLEQAGFFSSRTKDGARIFPDDSAGLVSRLARLSSDNVPLVEAIERLKGGDLEETTKLRNLEKQIEGLTRNVESLSALVQVQLSKAPALPERAGFWYHVKAAFASLFRKR